MPRKTVLIIAFAFLTMTSGCATQLGNGVTAYNQGQYQTALNSFNACANEGDSDCMNWIGVMYQRGQVTSDDPARDAIYWYTLSARYGNQYAKQNLARLGAPIPSPDLAPAPPSPAAMEAYGELGRAIGTAIGGGL